VCAHALLPHRCCSSVHGAVLEQGFAEACLRTCCCCCCEGLSTERGAGASIVHVAKGVEGVCKGVHEFMHIDICLSHYWYPQCDSPCL